MDIIIVNNDPIGTPKDIASVFTKAVQQAVDQLMDNIGRPEVVVNLANLEQQLERVVGVYVQETVNNSGKIACIDFAGHIIDKGEKDKENLERIFNEYFYGNKG